MDFNLDMLQDNPIITLPLLVAIIIGLSKVIQSIDIINNKFIPLISLFLGVILNLFINGFTFNSAVIGLVVGLTSVGTHSSTKNILEGVNKK